MRGITCALVLCGSVVRAQSFNLDAGSALGLPSDAYGAAAESPGHWQAIEVGGAAQALVDIDGQASAVTLTASPAFASAAATNDATSDDDEKLLEDYVDLGTSTVTLELTNLGAGDYQVYTYAWAPDDSSALSLVSVNGDNQQIGGAWSGVFEIFVTHALHAVEIEEGGSLTITVTGVTRGTLNGLQLVRTKDPEPIGEPRGFNLDAGTYYGEPASSYGGAADQPGTWMPLSFNLENPVKLVGLDGAVDSVTVTANLPFGPAWFDHPGPSEDEEKLLEDYLDLHTTGGMFDFRGLPAGDYLVYTYAWAPDDDRYRTLVTIDEVTQEVGGPWAGGMEQGVIYARHAVTVPASGRLKIQTFGTKGTLDGIQIVPVVDEPIVEVEAGAEAEESAGADAEAGAEVSAEAVAEASAEVGAAAEASASGGASDGCGCRGGGVESVFVWWVVGFGLRRRRCEFG